MLFCINISIVFSLFFMVVEFHFKAGQKECENNCMRVVYKLCELALAITKRINNSWFQYLLFCSVLSCSPIPVTYGWCPLQWISQIHDGTDRICNLQKNTIFRFVCNVSFGRIFCSCLLFICAGTLLFIQVHKHGKIGVKNNRNGEKSITCVCREKEEIKSTRSILKRPTKQSTFFFNYTLNI